MDVLNNLFRSIGNALPGILGALLLLIVALIVAWLIKRAVVTLLDKINMDRQLMHWGLAKTEDEADAFIENIASILYYIVILLFLPSILAGLNVGGVLNPIVGMFSVFVGFLPNLIVALIILILGGYFCNFVRRLVKNLLIGLNVDKTYRKLTGQRESLHVDENQIAEVLASVVYVLIYIPILTVALETLGIKSISQPIIDVLNQILGTIPDIFAAIVLLVIGSFVGKLLGDVIEGLLRTSGIDQYSKYLNFKGESQLTISHVTAKIVQGLLVLFFLVEAIAILNLEVLNTIGQAIIAYLPALISALVVLGIGLIGGNILARLVKDISGSNIFGELVRYLIISLAIFMTLDQLQIAQTIVNAGFMIIMGALAGAFILAFGLGGRDFAHRKLEEMDATIAQEADQAPILSNQEAVVESVVEDANNSSSDDTPNPIN